ncbi:dienelactone hydrolase [Rhizobium sullae]|uniref:Dienelactone hydrolase n=1 Tax=Rhizobium sullae TaxID=50338 RepID=A0A2N0D6E5_RHISU|nr:dienelactone hydrolase [Rhizobium sullae]PKA41678.1 dienelactone hydrolase [Rhizobium sullae]
MKQTLFLLVATATVVMLPLTQIKATDIVGVSNLSVPVPERHETMQITLWYPPTTGGTEMLIGDNALFQGVTARLNAPAAAGPWPLILLSHGGLKSGPNIDAWMASRLAASGFSVAMLRQPDPHTQAPQELLDEIWLRPADLSATLTAIEADMSLSGRIDTKRVGVFGFLVGGTSALALAGARFDSENFMRSCDPGGTGVDCADFARTGVDLRAVDASRLARSHLDSRIRAIFLVDPELSANFTPESLADISVPVDIVNLGNADTIWPGLNAAGLAGRIATANYDTVPDATQYDAFSECKNDAPDILRKEGEEPLCDETGDRSRNEIHEQLAAMAAAAFRRMLPR